MKEKIISLIFVSIIFIFSILTLVIKDKDISSYERRKLVTTTSLKEDFIINLDDYLSDQFPLRNELISTNSIFDRYILQNIDSNSVYIKNNFVIDKNYPLDEKSLNGFINKINYINDNYLQDSNVFYTIIPDKSYFLEDSKYLKIDYESVLSKIEDNLNIPYINIVDSLKLEDYYRTDIHIKQESYPKIIEQLSNYYSFEYQGNYIPEKITDKFYGASYSKVPSFTKPDELTILKNDVISSSTATHLEYGKKDIYELNRLNDADAYNVFLGGPSSLIEIENKSSKTDKELIIFRDSFGSGFSPLLIPYYKKITLIDLRYINMFLVPNYVDFTNKDVLFAYSTLIVNSSHILKVDYK